MFASALFIIYLLCEIYRIAQSVEKQSTFVVVQDWRETANEYIMNEHILKLGL